MPESFLNKVAGLRPITLFKKRLWNRCFPFSQNTFGKLLLTKVSATTFILILPRQFFRKKNIREFLFHDELCL